MKQDRPGSNGQLGYFRVTGLRNFILPLHPRPWESTGCPGCRGLFLISRRVRECPEHPATLLGAGPYLRGCPPPHVPHLSGTGQFHHVFPLLRARRQPQLPGGVLCAQLPAQHPSAHPAATPYLPWEGSPRHSLQPADPSAGQRRGRLSGLLELSPGCVL